MPDSRIFIEKKISAWLQRIDWLWLGAKGIGELRLKSVLIYHSENPRTLPNSVQLLSHVQLFATPWTTARQGFPVHHQLSELIQIHVHRVGDAIQPSHPLSYPSPPAFNLSQHQGLFQWSGGQSFGASASASVLPMSIQGWFSLGLTGLISLQFKGLSRVFSSTTAQKHQFFSAQPSLWFNSHIHTWLLEKP